MSAKMKMKVRSVQSTGKSKSRARVSSNCTCQKEHKSCSCQKEHKSCGRRQDPAVDAMQDAGKELSDIFKQLKNENVAEKLVRAIRCRDARAVQSILDCDCRVVSFFCTRDNDCVKICCSFGRYNDVNVTFDICVKRAQDFCRRNNFWF